MDTETPKTIVLRYFHQLLNEHNISICDELLAPEYVDHDAPAGTPKGPNPTKAFVTAFLKEYPDLQVQIADILAEGHKVAARIIWQGRQEHTGAQLHQVGIVMLHLNERGQLVERWSSYTTFTADN